MPTTISPPAGAVLGISEEEVIRCHQITRVGRAGRLSTLEKKIIEYQLREDAHAPAGYEPRAFANETVSESVAPGQLHRRLCWSAGSSIWVRWW